MNPQKTTSEPEPTITHIEKQNARKAVSCCFVISFLFLLYNNIEKLAVEKQVG